MGQGNGRIVLLDAALHLFEQGFGERGMGRHGGFEVGILGVEIIEHIGVGDVRVAGIADPRPRIVDRDAVVGRRRGTLGGGRRGGQLGQLNLRSP